MLTLCALQMLVLLIIIIILLSNYEVDGLEAVWAEVMVDNVSFVVGSVYTVYALWTTR